MPRFARIAAILFALLLTTAGAVSAEVLSTAFTYQGEVALSGSPLNDSADFEFSLYDALSGGIQVGTLLSINNVTVTDGVFAVLLDFGVDVFNGEARYLEIALRSPAGGGAYTTLSPRVTLTPTPYALQTRGIFVDSAENVRIGSSTPPAATGSEYQPAAPAVKLKVFAHGPGDAAVDAEATALTGVSDGMRGKSASSQGRGVVGEATSTSGDTRGVVGKTYSPDGQGVRGEGKTGIHGSSADAGGKGIMGQADADANSIGVHGKSALGEGVRGEGKTGIHGSSADAGGKGIMGQADTDANSIGVHGKSALGEGVRGEGKTGIHGSSADAGGKGIMGQADMDANSIGVHGKSALGEGVRGEGKTGIHGSSADAGGKGIMGQADTDANSIGVHGKSAMGDGVRGEGKMGVHGSSTDPGGKGIMGQADADGSSIGVHGKSAMGEGVRGEGKMGVHGSSTNPAGTGIMGQADVDASSIGVHGMSAAGDGVRGEGKTGVHGSSGLASGFGVYGLSTSTDPEGAGVRAEGNGYSTPGNPQAAALEIRNGALVVGGAIRPAGMIEIHGNQESWQEIESCDSNGGTTHTHIIGYETEVSLENELIVSDSSIFLTVEWLGPAIPNVTWTANFKIVPSPGEAAIRVGALGLQDTPASCMEPTGIIRVHYLIVNPAP